RSPSSEASGVVPVSACIGEPPAVWCGFPPALSRGFAHSMQNLAVGEFSLSQEGHRGVNGDAHSSQNFARAGFLPPHFEPRIAPLPLLPFRTRGLCVTAANPLLNWAS